MSNNKLIIAGSRSFDDYHLLATEVKQFIVDENILCPTIVSGTSRGADKLGEFFAKRYNLSIERFPANWNKFGRSAGFMRNELMASVSTHCIVFWDNVSPGTRSMIDLSIKYNLKLKIISF